MNKIVIIAQALMILIFVGASLFLIISPPVRMDQFTSTQYRLFGCVLLLYATFRTYKVYRQYF